MRPLSAPPRAAALLALACGCSVLEAPEVENPPADLVLRGVKVDHTVRGDRRARGTFAELRYHRDQAKLQGNSLRFEPIRADVSEGVLTADEARMTTRDGLGEAWGDVRFASASGDLFRTPRLGIDVGAQKSWSIEGVTVSGDGYELRAPRFKTTWDGPTTVRFDGGVRSTVRETRPPPDPKAKPAKGASRSRSGKAAGQR